ncbi:MAG: AbrB family transcriptional regulator [Porticoccaceae bacterium]
MPDHRSVEFFRFGKLPLYQQWVLLLLGSGLLSALLAKAGMPGALLLGPMVGGIIFRTNGATVAFPELPYLAAQTLVGCFIASKVTPQSVVGFIAQWPLLLSTAVVIISSSTLLGYVMSRYRLLPGTVAIWGLSPGAASAMIVMAEAFGEDIRLVAFMQYLRAVAIAVIAAATVAIWFGAANNSTPAVVWFPSIHVGPFLETLAIALAGALTAITLRIPGGMILVPFIGGAVLQATGLVAIELPPWFMGGAIAAVGWRVGLGFTRELLWHSFRVLPWVLLSISIMIGICGVLAWILVQWLAVDPLTALLATAPGGLDTMAVIAVSARADIAFVMALQTVRFLLVLALAPVLARFAARHLAPRVAGDRG